MTHYRRDGAVPKVITALFAILALIVFAVALRGAVRALAEAPAETAEAAGPDESGMPSGTDGAEEGSAEPEETPSPTPAPDFAEDGTQYLHCRNVTAAEVSLNGAWNAEEITLDQYSRYSGGGPEAGRLFPVPGTGFKGGEALLLEKAFYVDGFDAENGRIYLKMGETFYEPKVYVNGTRVASARFSYGEIAADISDCVTDGANTLRVVLKNGKASVYGCGSFMGIDGDVVLSYGPGAYFDRVNVLPDIDSGTVSIEASIYDPAGVMTGKKLEVNIFELGIFENGEAALHNGAGTDAVIIRGDGAGASTVCRMLVRLRGFDERKLWSPDSPFLYEAEISAGGIEKSLVFGIRSAAVDENRYVTLNGSAVFISGITVDRDLIENAGLTDGTAISAFFREIKGFGINTVKAENMIFPSRWYDAADRAGVFLVSEYPLGTGDNAGTSAATFRSEILALAAKLFSHPSHIIFDAAADKAVVPGITAAAEEVLASPYAVPVSTGLSEPASGNYVIGCNVSILGGEVFLEDLPAEAPYMNNMPDGVSWSIRTAEGAGIVTSLTDNILVDGNGNYVSEESASWWRTRENRLYEDTREARLSSYYGVLKELLAYWRTSRKYAGIILPLDAVKTGLTGSAAKNGGSEGLFRSEFEAAVGNAFAEIGLNIESYSVEAERGGRVAVDVAVTNNTPADLGTVEVTFTLTSGSAVLYQETKQYDSLKKIGTPGRDIMRREFSFEMPKSIRDGTEVVLSARLVVNGETVESSRTAVVSGGDTYEDPYSQMIVAVVTAALGVLIFGAVAVAFIMSRNYNVRTRKQAGK